MKALRRYFRTAKAGKGATPRHDPVVSIFPFEYATRGIGRRRECLSGGGDGSQHRGLQAFGYLAGVSGCVKARINGEQRIPHPAICGAGDDSERWVGI